MAMVIAVVIIGVAVPAIKGVIGDNKAHASFEQFDALAQEAHAKSIAERRAYILIWSPKYVMVRPDEPANKAEAKGGTQLPIAENEALEFVPVASLLANDRKTPVLAIWTFWPSGVCEPARIRFKGKSGKWVADYNPFTTQAEVRYD